MKMNKNVVERVSASLVNKHFDITGDAVVELFECGLAYGEVVAVLSLMESRVSSEMIVEMLGLEVNEKLAALLENNYAESIVRGNRNTELSCSDDSYDAMEYSFAIDDVLSKVESFIG